MDIGGMSKEALEATISAMEASGEYRVLRRFKPVDRFHEDDGAKKRIAMVLDTETTGVDFVRDIVFEIGFVLVEFAPSTGKVYAVLERYSGFQDPGVPIPANIQKLTGVCDDDVRGQQFDREQILAAVARADVVIAKNAQFDRRMLEKTFPEFQQKYWACAEAEGPWAAMGMTSLKQEFLAVMVGGVFYSAHRALTDVEVLLHIITRPAHDGHPILKHILEKARQISYRVWAMRAPIENKDILKLEAGYQWSGDDQALIVKTWYRDYVEDVEAELQFLANRVYSWQAKVMVDKLSAKERHSTRYQERISMDLPARAG